MSTSADDAGWGDADDPDGDAGWDVGSSDGEWPDADGEAGAAAAPRGGGGGFGGSRSSGPAVDENVRIRTDVDLKELLLLKRFVGAVRFLPTGAVAIEIGIELSKSGFSEDTIRAWGLANGLVVVHIEFGPRYLEGRYRPDFRVFQADSLFSSESHPIENAWALVHRLEAVFFRRWPPQPHELRPKLWFPPIAEVMEICSVNYLTALAAMRLNGMHSQKAAVYLTDSIAAAAEARRRAAETRVKASTGNQFVHEAVSAKFLDDPEEQQMRYEDNPLAEVFCVSPDVVDLAIERAGVTESAQDLLMDPKRRNEIVAIVELQHHDRNIAVELREHNILVQLALFVEKTLSSVLLKCPLCSRLQFVGWAVSDQLAAEHDTCPCPFQGVGFSLAGGVQAHGEVCDLLISMTAAACTLNRMEFCFPSEVVSIDGRRYVNSSGDQDLDLLKATITKLPPIAQLQRSLREGALRRDLEQRDTLLYPTLQWILSSSQARIRRLKTSDRMEEMKTDLQFVFVSSAPGREEKFQELKRAAEEEKGAGQGTIWAWHGSPFGNWNSIVRAGLKNMSSTKYQMHGAAHGAGIYFGKQASTSLGYCRNSKQTTWPASALGSNVYVLALCEVINNSKLKDVGWCLVCPEDTMVASRYLFVYCKGHGCDKEAASTPTINVKAQELAQKLRGLADPSM